jgi:hypothetical protein
MIKKYQVDYHCSHKIQYNNLQLLYAILLNYKRRLENLTGIVVVLAFSMSLLSMSLIATPSIISKAYAQNSSGSALTKVNKTGGLTASPKEAMTSGVVKMLG